MPADLFLADLKKNAQDLPSGDVHLGFSSAIRVIKWRVVRLALAFNENPSSWRFVDPVVEGSVRAISIVS
ncbi:MAG: hypothetical protein H6937_09660 [Burkholderiales bacterium]|nr:hypothetical protein [Burkholderiales bacterium]